MPKKLHIKTYGCQMNVYDSVRMADVLAPVGYEETADPAEADLIIFNTCHIREKAAEKLYSDLGRVRAVKEARAGAGKVTKIAVAGCVAQAEGQEIMRRMPLVDMVVGSQSYQELPRLLGELERSGSKGVALDFPEMQKFDLLPETLKPQGVSAFIAVQEGCDKFCSFCVVPYTRGAEYSRPVADVEAEVRKQVEQGTVEVTLLGQNVNAYHGVDDKGGAVSLAGLIRKLASIPELKRIRYTTSHPQDMTEELFRVHAEEEKLMPYLHLPVQSGSDRILKAMNRKHTAADYITIIQKLRDMRPDIAFSSDFIVGFPGETEEDFLATMRLVETVGYASAYSFNYSPRPGTPAAEKDGQLDLEVKSERLARLQALLNAQQADFNQRTIGCEFDILLDRKGREAGQMIGRSPYMQAVCVERAAALKGKLVPVRVTGLNTFSLRGEIIGDANRGAAA